jgi:hypothetical protein
MGIFPNTDSLRRLFTAVLQSQHDEWQDGRRHFSQQSMARLLQPDGPSLLTNPHYNTRISPGGSDTAAHDRPSGRLTIVSSRTSLATSWPVTAIGGSPRFWPTEQTPFDARQPRSGRLRVRHAPVFGLSKRVRQIEAGPDPALVVLASKTAARP